MFPPEFPVPRNSVQMARSGKICQQQSKQNVHTQEQMHAEQCKDATQPTKPNAPVANSETRTRTPVNVTFNFLSSPEVQAPPKSHGRNFKILQASVVSARPGVIRRLRGSKVTEHSSGRTVYDLCCSLRNPTSSTYSPGAIKHIQVAAQALEDPLRFVLHDSCHSGETSSSHRRGLRWPLCGPGSCRSRGHTCHDPRSSRAGEPCSPRMCVMLF